MTLVSNFPNGFANGVSVRGLPVLNTYGGNVYWVNSNGGSNGNKGTRERPWATLDYAIGRCTANNGDIIMVGPNHAETITGAGGIAADVAGITIVGMGSYNQRPRFLMDGGTTVTFTISAADVTVSGLEFASGHASVVACFDITAVGAHINDCKFRNNTTNENFLSPIKATGADASAAGLKVTNCDWYTIDTDDAAFITFAGSAADVWVWDNKVITSSATAAQLISVATGKLLTNADIGWNRLVNAMTSGELFISNDGTTNTGIIHNNYVGHADVTGAHDPGWDGGGFRLFNNLSTSVDNLQGLLIPAADANL
jgi:hypothetical protein